MKKTVCLICVISMLSFALMSCTNTMSEQSSEQSIDSNEIINYTITREADYVASAPEDMFEISDVVVEGTFGDTLNTYVSDNSFPVTQVAFNVNSTLKGNVPDSKIIVEYYGGTVSMYSYLDSLTEEQILKRGIDCSVAEASKMTVSYADTKESVSVNTSDTYMLFLTYDKETDTYFILCDAYGACKMDHGCIYSLAEEKYVSVDFKDSIK